MPLLKVTKAQLQGIVDETSAIIKAEFEKVQRVDLWTKDHFIYFLDMSRVEGVGEPHLLAYSYPVYVSTKGSFKALRHDMKYLPDDGEIFVSTSELNTMNNPVDVKYAAFKLSSKEAFMMKEEFGIEHDVLDELLAAISET